MIVALDVHYTGSTAHAAAVGFDEWQSDKCIASYTAMESPVAEYEPGKFCVRELSPLLKVIRQIDSNITTYVIDGYCHLSSDLAPGLGAYLHEALAEPTAIVGIAKNRYRQTQHAIEVFRGKPSPALRDLHRNRIRCGRSMRSIDDWAIPSSRNAQGS